MHSGADQHDVTNPRISASLGNFDWLSQKNFHQSKRTLLSQNAGAVAGPLLSPGLSSTKRPFRTWTIRSAE